MWIEFERRKNLTGCFKQAKFGFSKRPADEWADIIVDMGEGYYPTDPSQLGLLKTQQIWKLLSSNLINFFFFKNIWCQSLQPDKRRMTYKDIGVGGGGGVVGVLSSFQFNCCSPQTLRDWNWILRFGSVCFGFFGISTFVRYLIPKSPFLNINGTI